MDANQVQQATEDLITDRNRLSAEAQGGGASRPSGPAPATKKPPAADGSGYTGAAAMARRPPAPKPSDKSPVLV